MVDDQMNRSSASVACGAIWRYDLASVNGFHRLSKSLNMSPNQSTALVQYVASQSAIPPSSPQESGYLHNKKQRILINTNTSNFLAQ